MNRPCRDSRSTFGAGATFIVDKSLSNDVATARVRDQKLGHGSYGAIYETSSQSKEDNLVTKVVDVQICTLLELAIMTSLRHKNLNWSRAICSGVDDSVYIVQDRAMADYVSYYQSTYQQRERQTSYPESEVIIEWFWELAQAVKALHAMSIVHGDIKAANILVSSNGSLVLGDFGMACFECPVSKEDARYRCSSTRPVGTLSHKPSEAMEGGPWSFPLDIWALGCTFYQMYYGQLLFSPDRSDPEGNMARFGLWEEIRALILGHEKIPLRHREMLDLHEDFGSAANAFVDVIIVNMLVNDPASRPDASTVATYLSCLIGREAETTLLLAEPVTRKVTSHEVATLSKMPKVSALTRGWTLELLARLRREASLEDIKTMVVLVECLTNLRRENSTKKRRRKHMMQLAHEIGYYLILHPTVMAQLRASS